MLEWPLRVSGDLRGPQRLMDLWIDGKIPPYSHDNFNFNFISNFNDNSNFDEILKIKKKKEITTLMKITLH